MTRHSNEYKLHIPKLMPLRAYSVCDSPASVLQYSAPKQGFKPHTDHDDRMTIALNCAPTIGRGALSFSEL